MPYLVTLAELAADPAVDEPLCVARVSASVARRVLALIAQGVGRDVAPPAREHSKPDRES